MNTELIYDINIPVVLEKIMKIGKFFKSLAAACYSVLAWLFALFLVIILISISVILMALPATYDLLRFLAWRFSTKKMQRRWYHKSLRKRLASEMIRFRCECYNLYVSDDGQAHCETNDKVSKGFFDLHLAKPGNAHWRAYVRNQMYLFRRRFKDSQVFCVLALVKAFFSM